MQTIRVDQMPEFRIGHAQNEEAMTGVTVLYFPEGARVGVDISGGGPASRETPLAGPLTADNPINAVVLGGGSAFGLAASDGVMQCLEEHGIGFDTGLFKVPLVLQSDIYDLGVGDGRIRPDARMGREACENALAGSDDRKGLVGAGIGATVGKMMGPDHMETSGLGLAVRQIGPLKLAAVVVVNAVGDIYDPKTGQKIAGVRLNDGSFADTMQVLTAGLLPETESPMTNTTIGCIVTNADFDAAQVNKLAMMSRAAYDRTIKPVGTMMDGDSIYFASTGKIKADINLVGTLAAEVMEEAILSIFQQ